MKIYYVYILKCSDGLTYTGITNNVSRRFNDANQAIFFEKKIKKWSRKKKLALANGNFDMVQILSECRNASHSKYKPEIKQVSFLDCARNDNSILKK